MGEPLHKSKELNKKKRRELVDLLRKNMLYQTPKPIFSMADDDHPTHVEIRMLFAHQQRILQLINEAGGWVLPRLEKEKLLHRHEEAARVAYGDGTDYDLSHLSYGEMVAMHAELNDIQEMTEFREALADAMKDTEGQANG